MLISILLAMAIQPATKATISVDAAKPGIRISPDLYGIFFEEINCAGDGGIYAELVRNRGFEDNPDQPDHWELETTGTAKGEMAIESVPLGSENSRWLRVTFRGGEGTVSLVNRGYWGIPVVKGEQYALNFTVQGDGSDSFFTSRLIGKDGKTLWTCPFDTKSKEWRKLGVIVKPIATDPEAKLALTLDKPCTIWLEMVSLFPTKTFKDRTNGLRPDLAQMLCDLHPSFMRFPGGCWVEGDTMATAQRWKRTVGDLRERRTLQNLWGYMSTNGLGYHEYLQMCEDIGAAPLFVINCGMSHKEIVPMAQMDEFVQDALDAIEYANGPVTSKWGALRAKNGHPEPFHLKYLEIGNENGGAPYRERYPLIASAVKAKYPEIKLIANVWGGYPQGELTETIDEHYYSNPQFFIENADRYDHYDRKGPKIYVGEYACTEGCGGGNLIAAVGEAAFMTGMERNSDVVTMSSYAPLFANVNYKKWNPDLINFDGHRVYGTPSYYVQQMFSQNRGDAVLPANVQVSGSEPQTFPAGGIGVGTWATQADFKDVKVVSAGKTILDSPDGSALKAGIGRWAVADQALRQSGNQDGTRATGGDRDWANYTLSLKARKTGGREGFLITFGMRDEKNWTWWNVGGWGNHQHAIERSVDGGKSILGQAVNGSIETGRWYDLRVDYSPDRIRCYLDGKLIHDVPCPQPKPLHVVASRVDKTGEVILKIVNSSSQPIAAAIDLKGMPLPFKGTETVLTAKDPLAENTLEEPKKVAPITRQVTGKLPSLKRTLPAYSVTVLRLKPQ